MRSVRRLLLWVVAAAVLFNAAPRLGQTVAKKAMAPDAIDLNSASAEQLTKLGIDEATMKKVVDTMPFTVPDDPKLKEAVPEDLLEKLEGKIDVKPPVKDAKPPAK